MNRVIGLTFLVLFVIGVPIAYGSPIYFDHDIVVDNTDTAYVASVGNWFSLDNGWFVGSDWQYASGGANNGNSTFTWYPNVTAASLYEVYVVWTQHKNRSDNAPYTVFHNGVTSPVVTKNQQVAPEYNGSYLGTFYFSGDPSEYVRLGNNVEGYVVADAIGLDAVPINASIWLLGSGLAGLVAIRKRLNN